MDTKTKHRIIGVVVLVALAIIIIPLFFGRSQSTHEKANNLSTHVPNPPEKQATQLAIPAQQLAPTTPQATPTTTTSTGDLATQAMQSTPVTAEAVDQNTNNSDASLQNQQPAATNPSTATVNSVPAKSPTPAAPSPAATPVPATDTENMNSVTQQSPAVESTEAVPRTKTGAVKKKLVKSEHATKHEKHHPEKLAAKHSERHLAKHKVKPAAVPNAWAIQLASFSQKANAEQLVKHLRAKGFAAYIHQAHSEHGIVSRVFVGPELKKERADLVLKKLHETFRLKGVVVEYHV